MDGIIVLNKPIGLTSHDCVMRLRRILNESRIGHTGTLDPNVDGVLVICIGRATKLVDILLNKDKEYLCTCLLGIETDTEDITGKVINEEEVPLITNEKIDLVLNSFIGEGKQIPPMYSAVKINGKKLYEYARKNIEVKREERSIYINLIERKSDYVDNTFSFVVNSKKGLYVRTLATDIAKRLNTIGTMKALTRTKSGEFSISESYTFEQIENNDYSIISLKDFVKRFHKYVVKDYLVNLIKNGIILDERQLIIDKPFTCYDKFDNILALYMPISSNETRYKPVIIF